MMSSLDPHPFFTVMKYNKHTKMETMRDTTFLTNRIQHNSDCEHNYGIRIKEDNFIKNMCSKCGDVE